MFKLIPRLKPDYTISDWMSVLNIFQKNPIKLYEKEFAQKFENTYGVMFQHGRSGLYALLKVWGLKNAEVICPAYTCVVVPNAIVLSKNIPVFVDSAKDSFNMDINLLEESITQNTRVIVVTHIFGYAMDVESIEQIVKNAQKKYNHKIYVIQDVAHSYGTRYDDKLVTKYGDACIFGSNISKLINTIFGGMVITNSKTTYELLTNWRKSNTKKSYIIKPLKRFLYFFAVNIAFNAYIYGIINYIEKLGFLDKFVKYYEEDRIYFPNDWDMFPSNIEARIGLSQLKKYDNIIQKRVKNAKNWQEKLKNDDIDFMGDESGCTFSHCVGLVKNREAWLKSYRKKGIELGILIEYSIPYMKAFKQYKKREYPVSLEYSKMSINFPNW